MRMLRWIFTLISLFCCLILIPVDAVYSAKHDKDSSAPTVSRRGLFDTINDDNDRDTRNFLSASLAGVYGNFLWSHVVMEYIVTLIMLVFLWVYYRHAIKLRQQFFSSDKYQRSFSSRTLLITNIQSKLRSAASLRNVLENTMIPYPIIEVQIGNNFGDLPILLEKQHELTHQIELLLNQYLSKKDPTYPRPQLVINKTHLGLCGGTQVDAIDHYGTALAQVEEQIEAARKELDTHATMPYGFVSLAAPHYAHTAARVLHNKRPSGLSVCLAPFPRDLIWKNLCLSRGQRRRLQLLGYLMCLVFFFVNVLPVIATSFLSNLELFSTLIAFLRKWHDVSPNTFAAVSGLFPPVISVCFALLLPHVMLRIVVYQGVRTREIRDVALCGQYFLFLYLAQFVVFTLMGVAAEAALTVKGMIEKHESAGSVVDNVAYHILEHIASQLPKQSIYWMTWSTVRIYLVFFELAQVIRVVLVWIQKHTSKLTPRRALLLSKPPSFEYWRAYPEMLFPAVIGIIYAPLAPLVVAFIAALFWIASIIYKYQLLYVYTTASETGGRLWQVAINRILAGLIIMQLIMALVVGLKVSNATDQWDMWSWVKAIACLPPCLIVIAFKLYCHVYLDKAFRWYDPSPFDIANSAAPAPDLEPHLERQFGHPFLHDTLWTPIVAAEYMPMVKRVYNGAVQSSRHKDRILERPRYSSASDLVDEESKSEPLMTVDSTFTGYVPTQTEDIELGHVQYRARDHEDTPLVTYPTAGSHFQEPTMISAAAHESLESLSDSIPKTHSDVISRRESDVISYYAAIGDQNK